MEVTKVHWYHKPWGVILLLIFFFPIGLYLMWKRMPWSRNVKWGVTLAIVVVFAVSQATEPEHRRAQDARIAEIQAEKVNGEAQKAAEKEKREYAERQAKAERAAMISVPGQYGRILVPGSEGPILLATSKSDLSEYSKLAIARDTLGVQQMMTRGSLIAVAPGTKALVIGNGWLTTEVRIQEGSHLGRAAWAPEEWVRVDPY